jgi:hypothetical protein
MALIHERSERMRPLPTSLVGILVLLASLLAFPLVLAPRAEAYIYWTNEDTIGRADLDGSGVKSRFIAEAGSPNHLALDAEHIYWTNRATDVIGRANLDGTGVDQGFIGAFNPKGVAVDTDHVYWTWSECEAGCSTTELQTAVGGIGRANLDGTGVDQSFIGGINPTGVGADSGYVAVDAQHIYWTGTFCEGVCTTDRLVFAIGRANLDGTGVDRAFIVTGGGSTFPGFEGPISTITGVDGTDLAVDAQHIYWTGRTLVACCGATLGRANLDGTAVDQGFIDGPCCLYPPRWTGIAVDDAHIYWTEHQPRDQPTRSILRANLDGSGLERFITPGSDRRPALPDRAEGFDPTALAVDARTVTRAEAKASAAKTQRQTGKRIVVRVRVKAKERLTATATGQIEVNPTYELRPETVEMVRGDARRLRLKPKKAKAGKIARALRRGEKAKAKVRVKLIDAAGSSKTEKLRVRLTR